MSSPAVWYGVIGLVAALVLGHGMYWFIGGSAADHSSVRNSFVISQILIAAAVLAWAQLRIWRSRGAAGAE